MSEWEWILPGRRKWKVSSDNEKGTFILMDEKNNIILNESGHVIKAEPEDQDGMEAFDVPKLRKEGYGK